MRKPATQPKHFHIFSTNSKFSQSFTTYYNFFTTYSFPPFSLYTFPPSEKSETVKGKRKKYCRHIKKEPTCRTDFSAAQIGSMNYQRYFFPLTGAFFSDTIHLKKIKFQRNIKLFFLFFRTSIRYKI